MFLHWSSFSVTVLVGGHSQDWFPLTWLPWNLHAACRILIEPPPTSDGTSSYAHLLAMSLKPKKPDSSTIHFYSEHSFVCNFNLYLETWKFWSFLSLKNPAKTLPHTLGKSFLLPRHFAIHSALDLCCKDQQKQSTTLEWCYTPGKLSH